MSIPPISARPHSFYIRPAPGWLDILAEEVTSILKEPFQKYKFEPLLTALKGTVKVHRCDWRQGLELTMRLNTAHDVEWLLGEFPCTNWNQFESTIKKIDWTEIGLKSGESVHVSIELGTSFTQGSAKIREKVCQIGKLIHVSEGALIRIKVQLRNERLRILVSLAGPPLYQRGYKKNLSATAPLPEHLASACIRWTLSGIIPETKVSQIWIPFAGSGTFAFETIMSLLKLGPGSFSRKFAFESFPVTSQATIQHFRKKIAPSHSIEHLPKILLNEINAEAMKDLKENIESFPVPLQCQFQEGDFFEASPPSQHESGSLLVLLNPPFGARLGKQSDISYLYGRLAKKLKSDLESFKGRVIGSCICPSENTWKTFIQNLGGKGVETHHFSHGGEQMRLVKWQFD